MKRITPEERAEQKRQINELYERFYGSRKAGDPAKYDVTNAGPQGNMFDLQAQSPKKAKASMVPQEKQIEATMFKEPKPDEPTLFDCNESQEGNDDAGI